MKSILTAIELNSTSNISTHVFPVYACECWLRQYGAREVNYWLLSFMQNTAEAKTKDSGDSAYQIYPPNRNKHQEVRKDAKESNNLPFLPLRP